MYPFLFDPVNPKGGNRDGKEKLHTDIVLDVINPYLFCFLQVGKKELECQVYPIDKPYDFQ